MIHTHQQASLYKLVFRSDKRKPPPHSHTHYLLHHRIFEFVVLSSDSANSISAVDATNPTTGTSDSGSVLYEAVYSQAYLQGEAAIHSARITYSTHPPLYIFMIHHQRTKPMFFQLVSSTQSCIYQYDTYTQELALLLCIYYVLSEPTS